MAWPLPAWPCAAGNCSRLSHPPTSELCPQCSMTAPLAESKHLTPGSDGLQRLPQSAFSLLIILILLPSAVQTEYIISSLVSPAREENLFRRGILETVALSYTSYHHFMNIFELSLTTYAFIRLLLCSAYPHSLANDKLQKSSVSAFYFSL